HRAGGRSGRLFGVPGGGRGRQRRFGVGDALLRFGRQRSGRESQRQRQSQRRRHASCAPVKSRHGPSPCKCSSRRVEAAAASPQSGFSPSSFFSASASSSSLMTGGPPRPSRRFFRLNKAL